jgi:hypothetical protein
LVSGGETPFRLFTPSNETIAPGITLEIAA